MKKHLRVLRTLFVKDIVDMFKNPNVLLMLALPLIYLPLRTGIRVPKYVSYLFYPAHLALIYLLTM